MRTRAYAVGLAGFSLLTAGTGAARALDKRADVEQQGDFLLIGNTLAQDCGPNIPAPIVGTLDCANAGNVGDLAPDVFWRAEAGAAQANSMIAMDQAQSAATLALPKSAAVTHAYLYWAAQNYAMTDNAVTIQCVDQGGAPMDVQAQSTWLGPFGDYGAVADIKPFIDANGSCTYLVGGVQSATFGGAQSQTFGYSVWWMVVLYADPTAPHKRLMVFDGLDTIGNGGESLSSFTGFTIPKHFGQFSTAKLGVAAYDGDASLGGDRLFLNDVLLKDAAGNETNFFNSSRSYLGAPLSVPGDLPQLSGEPGSMDRLDLDVVDVSPLLTEGQSQIDVKASSDGEIFDLIGLALSVPTFTDADNDGLSDDEETLLGTSPTDADSDDDGVQDGQEGCAALGCADPAWSADADADGLINALDPDSDNDGLLDGTELGLDCLGIGTTIAAGDCEPDADPATTTDPLSADSDGGGARDGSEDANLNGKLDAGETDPTALAAADDATVVDTDKDGLSDGLEAILGSSPTDADSDDDGLLDGLEPNPSCDTDGDGLGNVLDVDSDNDALYDGTEAGKDCSDPATMKGAVIHCIADADPATVTSPLLADTDGGGATDASEDWNRNGALDAGETDPTAGHADDDTTTKDADGDGLSDELEVTLGSSSGDKDSDDDGVLDGAEANPGDDTDGDGAMNANDPDSDGDGLFDGTERGKGCADPDTDKSKNQCIKDGDTGKTKTCAIDADTDDGGVSDGAEDFNKDGVYDVDAGEGDPNNKVDDGLITPCTADAECGPPDSGFVCEDAAKHCIMGCRGVDGSRCPTGQVCSSDTSKIGACIDATGPGSGGGSGAGGAGAGGGGADGGGDGRSCNCVVAAPSRDDAAPWLLAALAGAACALRRRARAR